MSEVENRNDFNNQENFVAIALEQGYRFGKRKRVKGVIRTLSVPTNDNQDKYLVKVVSKNPTWTDLISIKVDDFRMDNQQLLNTIDRLGIATKKVDGVWFASYEDTNVSSFYFRSAVMKVILAKRENIGPQKHYFPEIVFPT